MAIKIRIPDSAYSEQQVNLADTVLTFTLKFNSRNSAWYLDIKDAANTSDVKTGIKVMPNQNLTGRYLIDELQNGNIWCLRQQSTFDDIDRENLGINEAYGLWYLTSSEEEELQIDGVIQL